jgi:hypothetical protein
MDELDERITYGTDAHANDPDEVPEDRMGQVISDPWDDPRQTDWVTTRADLDEAA